MVRPELTFKGINHNIVKEIDFNKDIDAEMSDRYEIDPKLDCLRFMFKELKKFENADDYIRILGKKFEHSGSVELIAEKAREFGDNIYFANMIIKGSTFIEDIDGICFQFDKPKNASVSLCIINSYFYDVLIKMSKKELPLDGKYYAETDTKRLKIDCFDNSLSISNYSKHKLLEGYSSTLELKDKIDGMILDISKKQIILNNFKYPIPVADGIIENQIYLNIIEFIEQEKIIDGNTRFLVKSLIYLKKEGFIYLKPIKVGRIRIKVFIAYYGEPIFEVYSNKTGEWVGITNGKEFQEEIIKLRARMNYGDKVYKIVLIEI